MWMFFGIICIILSYALAFKHPSASRRVLTMRWSMTSSTAQTSSSPQHPCDIATTATNKQLRSIFQAVAMVGGVTMLSASKALAVQSYLSEPTVEFKDEEKKVSEFGEARQKIRKDWDKIIDHFVSTENSAELEADLKALRLLLISQADIPVGTKLTSLVKTARAKKFDPNSPPKRKIIMPYWTTPVEIAYQALVLQYKKQASPAGLVRYFTTC
jgi:hypothetical protein